MTKTEVQQAALGLAVEERRELVEALWESLDTEPSPPLPEWQRQLLDERLAELERHPDPGTPWDEVEREIWADQE